MLPPQVGSVIFGRYRLRREIARGGMSSVWEGEDRKLRRAVAVKILVSTAAKSRDAAPRFEREAMAVAQLQSPHIVQIFDYGVERECPFIVMELLEGEDLRTRLRRVGRMPLEDLVPIVVQTAKGLGAAHSAGLVHRDLKPGNIFLVRSRDEELVKLLDFGVAKATAGSDLEQETTKDGAILGTPRYMSPEQALGSRSLDHRSDLWSLAVIVFRALTGRPPFTGKTPADVVVRVCTQPFPKATDVAPDLPVALDAFFDRALRREPEERFPSAREFVRALVDLSPASFPSLELPAPFSPQSRSPATLRGFPRPKPPLPRRRAQGPAAAGTGGVSEALAAAGSRSDPAQADPDDVATIAVSPEQLLGTPVDDDQTCLSLEPDPDGADDAPTEVDEPGAEVDRAERVDPTSSRLPAGPIADHVPASTAAPPRRSWAWLVVAGMVLGVLVALLARLAPSGGEGGGAPQGTTEASVAEPSPSVVAVAGARDERPAPGRPEGVAAPAGDDETPGSGPPSAAPPHGPPHSPSPSPSVVQSPTSTTRPQAATASVAPTPASPPPAPPPTNPPDPFADRL